MQTKFYKVTKKGCYYLIEMGELMSAEFKILCLCCGAYDGMAMDTMI